jgi:anaerobic magnesium-protoporphyrin IX monomethyl ester cyclase
MTKILFIYPNNVFDGILPFGISLMTAYLRKGGHEVKLFDAIDYENEATDSRIGEKHGEFIPVEMPPKKPKEQLQEDLNELVSQFDPHIIGVSTTSFLFNAAMDMIQQLPQHNALVAFGGVHSEVCPEETIGSPLIDIVCIGEGEQAILELADAIQEGKDFTRIKSLWVKTGDTIHRNGLRTFQPLDELLFYDWSLFDRQFYKPFMGRLYKCGHYELSRGCPYSCTYCTNSYFKELFKGCGAHHRERSIPRAILELGQLKQEYGLEMLKFWDESFLAMRRERLQEFVEQYKRRIGLPFIIQTRPETINEHRVALLRSAGCAAISMGIESGSKRIRDEVLNRPMNDEVTIDAFKTVKKFGIRTSAFNMIGLPYETEEDILQTIELNKKAAPDSVGVSFFYPFKGTRLREVCEREGFIGKDSHEINIREGSMLEMPQIRKEKLNELRSTFDKRRWAA